MKKWIGLTFLLLVLVGGGNLASVMTQTGEAEETKKVLLIGNSFTRFERDGIVYSVEEPLENLAKAAGHELEVTTVAHGSAKLRYYAGFSEEHMSYHKELMLELVKGDWDYIVLQEHSRTMVAEYDDKSLKAIKELQSLTTLYQPEAKLLLYMTHGYQDGVPIQIAGTKTYPTTEELQTYLAAAYGYVGNELGIDIIPVGKQFAKCRALYPQTALLGLDAKHPSYAGYYLAACTFYQTLYGELPNGVPAASMTGCDINEAELLQLASVSQDFLQIDKKVLKLQVDEKEILYALTRTGEIVSSGVTYASMDESVAVVDTYTGEVTAKSGGHTVILAQTEDGMQACCNVIVDVPLSFSSARYTVGKGDKIRIFPKTTTENLKWTSSKKSVAVVNSKGVVTAKGAGKTTIRVENKDDASDDASYTLYVALNKPTGLRVKKADTVKRDAEYGALKVSWNKVKGAKKYYVYRSAKKNGAYKLIGVTNQKSYTDKLAKVNKAYYYKVMAGNAYKRCNSALSKSKRGSVKGTQ